MSSELSPSLILEEQTDPNLLERIRDTAANFRTKLGRIASAGLIVATGTFAVFTVEEAVHPVSARADVLGYPWPSDTEAPCQFGSAGGVSCVNPNNPNDKYDWGVYTNGFFHPYRSGYEYRNCTDYVQWKESTLGVTVPGNWGNGGQWYNNAPVSERSLIPKAWDAAVSPGTVGHVAFIESVNNNGTITVSEYNHAGTGIGGLRVGTPAALGFTEFVDFGVHPSPLPPPASRRSVGDYSGDGITDAAVFRPSDGTWHIRGVGDYSYGQSGDIPVPADYNGDHITDIAIYRPSEGGWHIRGVGDYPYGQNGDIPVPGDYNGNGVADRAVYRPSDGYWHINGVGDFQYGQAGDIPVPGYYNGDSSLDIAIYRPGEGGWHIRGVGDYPYGASTDIPVPGDYNGDGLTDKAVYRPVEGGWHISGVGDFPYGASTDIPVPAYYNNDNVTDAAVYRPAEGGWHLRGVGDFPYGASTDIPAVQTLNAFLLKKYGLIISY